MMPFLFFKILCMCTCECMARVCMLRSLKKSCEKEIVMRHSLLFCIFLYYIKALICDCLGINNVS